jgi:hypothetical protein
MSGSNRVVDLDRVVITHDVSIFGPGAGRPGCVVIETRLGEHLVTSGVTPFQALQYAHKIIGKAMECLA